MAHRIRHFPFIFFKTYINKAGIRSFYKVDRLKLGLNWWKTLTTQCPECNYTFSDKEDFITYAAAGEIIQCPVCQTELIINKDLQLEILDLESSGEHHE